VNEPSGRKFDDCFAMEQSTQSVPIIGVPEPEDDAAVDRSSCRRNFSVNGWIWETAVSGCGASFGIHSCLVFAIGIR
jgi:hypothetical protein